jgi:hypothetical protein
MFAETIGKSDKQGNLQMRIALSFMNGFKSGLKCWNQEDEALSTAEVRMTLKVKVKVTQGQISTLYANSSGLHGESNRSKQMTFKVKVKVIEGQASAIQLNVGSCSGKLPVLHADHRKSRKLVRNLLEGPYNHGKTRYSALATWKRGERRLHRLRTRACEGVWSSTPLVDDLTTRRAY